MLSPVEAGHQNIIKIYEHTVKAPAHCDHEALEYLCCILEPKWPPQEFIRAKNCDGGCLWDVCCCHRDLVVSTYEVNL